MPLQRQTNPLPPGRYCIINSGKAIGVFLEWLRINRSIVKVEASSLDSRAGGPVNEFVIFNVEFPAFLWPLSQLGFPSVAGPEIRTRDDFVQEPDVPLLPQSFGSIFEATSPLLLLALGVMLWQSLKK